MQLLESTVIGLRAARYRFASSSSPVSVTIFPMVHVGESGFYERVHDDAFSHDVVLIEGVKSPIGRHLTRTYRWIDPERLGLIIQPRTPDAASVAAMIIHADLSGEEFEAEWKKVPLYLRISFFLLAPLVGLKRRYFESRESLAERMTLEDRADAEEVLSWDPEWAALMHSLVHSRDARLLERLREQLEAPSTSPRRLAIVYGAMHMRAVVRELAKHRFQPVEAEWLTVFALD